MPALPHTSAPSPVSKTALVLMHTPTTHGDVDLLSTPIPAEALAEQMFPPAEATSSPAPALYLEKPDHRVELQDTPHAHSFPPLSTIDITCTRNPKTTESQDPHTTLIHTPAPWYERSSTHIISIILLMVLIVAIIELGQTINRCLGRQRNGSLPGARLEHQSSDFSTANKTHRQRLDPGFFDLDDDDDEQEEAEGQR